MAKPVRKLPWMSIYEEVRTSLGVYQERSTHIIAELPLSFKKLPELLKGEDTNEKFFVGKRQGGRKFLHLVAQKSVRIERREPRSPVETSLCLKGMPGFRRV